MTQEEKKDYNELFDTSLAMDDSLDTLLEDQEVGRLERRPSERVISVAHFTPRQGKYIFFNLINPHLMLPNYR